MTYIHFDPRAAERNLLARQAQASLLARECEKPRTLASALKLWLMGSHNSSISPAQRAIIAARIAKVLT